MGKKTVMLCYSALLCALIIISTLWFRFTIPGTDVMVTLQVFFVMLCANTLPPKYCLTTLGVYLLAGLIGLPVFSAVSGPAVLTTPSFGYLLGFPPASAAASLLRRKWEQKKGSDYLASLSGVVVLYVIAIIYIGMLHTVFITAPVSAMYLLTTHCLIFLPVDLLKAIGAAWLGKRLRTALRLH
ncbi:MAG: biotin transporter BioY [Clostridiales bacterium]|nr:biotin transporter BioY [Clostridiales bacterium]